MFLSQKITSPHEAYNLWAGTYDDQPDNLMLALDNEITVTMIGEMNLADKIVVDVGCGTGRHWEQFLGRNPAKLIGFDISELMLNKLRTKYPDMETNLIDDIYLDSLKDKSCDLIVSTLTIAHIRNISAAFREWNRVLKPRGEILITDYHPAALKKGGDRTFRHNGKTIAVKNFIHPLDKIRRSAIQLHWEEEKFIERRIDHRVKHFYEKQGALTVFERFMHVPIIYGMFLKKVNDPA